ncbi:MAG: hypothetical protein ACKVP5_18165 [Aestuariivirga sp.]
MALIKRFFFEFGVLGLVLVITLYGVIANSSIVGGWLGGSLAAAMDPLLFLGALLAGVAVRPSWLAMLISMLWAIIVGLIIVFVIRYWEELGLRQPSPISFHRITAALVLSSIASTFRGFASSKNARLP